MTDSIKTPTSNEKTAMYRQMLLIRRFEERCNQLYMRGEIPSTLHLYVGQEAVATGVCAHLRTDDYITSTHRPHGHALAKGVSARSIMAELYAKSTGCCKAKGGSMHVGDMDVGMLPAIAIVGGGIPIAAGLALGFKRKGSDRVAACFFGEGAANEGAFHEGLNMAAIWDLPVIYVCENNLYAASTPVGVTFKIENIADRVAAYGMAGEVVDGNDVLAVYEAMGRAVARARAGEGPTLLECKTYRQVGHSRSDPLTYRTKEEEKWWKERDPIERLGERLLAEGVTNQAGLDAIEADVTAEVDDAVAFAKASPDPDPTEALQHVFYGVEV
ncbi:MAG: thiamine pyrophosphate-dependent dehydrogenase E1 component subunit alpha [Caldilineales bacterium]|nr:thiamine pyrophosphate-dependent dehydrogenase E1 component subunit alpha [Caldilineales bacterium]